jgi:hypothetical protein
MTFSLIKCVGPTRICVLSDLVFLLQVGEWELWSTLTLIKGLVSSWFSKSSWQERKRRGLCDKSKRRERHCFVLICWILGSHKRYICILLEVPQQKSRPRVTVKYWEEKRDTNCHLFLIKVKFVFLIFLFNLFFHLKNI